MNNIDKEVSKKNKDNLENKDLPIRSSTAEYLTYIASSGESENTFEVRYEDENIWLTQKMMAELYGVTVPTINEHLKNIFNDYELDLNSVIRKFRITASDGKNYKTNHYNLQAIIAVGFKVNNERAVQFRKWANQIVKDYTIQGWVMDVDRLKNFGTVLNRDYFEKQLEKVREIRLSERRFYQKITDIYATALDYDKNSKTTRRFFAAVQNKLHYAVHGHTAAEVIYDRADSKKKNMGLSTWDGSPKEKIHKYDVVVAKNYLSETEMGQMQRIVSAYLDMAEDMALRNIPMTMEDWEKRLNGFLTLWDRKILQDAGKVTAELAKQHALSEFEKYRVIQDKIYTSDFDQFLELEAKLEDKDDKNDQ
ncbi:virulence RhuM family protein [Facklamia sp. P12955]|uniref:virulence RhuM family protein n=1 Tax=Facklamia sp. P12955 TaxID=3421946 RepID=UPI003D172181